YIILFFFSSSRRHTISKRDWSSDVCSSDLLLLAAFAITFFLTIISGIIVPLEGIASHYEWIDFFNPLQSFLANEATIGWLILFILIIAFWFVRKEFTYA